MGFKGFNHRTILETCKGCTDRHPACHDTCERYKAAKVEWDNRRENIKTEKRRLQAIDSYQISAIKQMRKGKR